MHFIDTHTHLYAEEFDIDGKEVIQNAIDLGVKHFYLPNIDIDSIESMNRLVSEFPENCFPMMGLHPCSVKEDWKNQLSIIEKELFSKPNYIAVGEIGIDLYWDKTFLKQQQEVFTQQIEWAKKLHLPIVIHVRDAFDEVFELVDQFHDDNLWGIFHCFSGNLSQAHKIIEYGNFKLGIGGVVTFKNAGLDKVLEEISLEHIVLETDSPYLAPAPHRGKRNESTYIPLIASKLSDIYNLSIDEIAEITSQNALSVFSKIKVE